VGKSEGDCPEVQNLDYSINLNLEQGYGVAFLLFTKVQYGLTTEFERIRRRLVEGCWEQARRRDSEHLRDFSEWMR
jgi:hypothetical protein